MRGRLYLTFLMTVFVVCLVFSGCSSSSQSAASADASVSSAESVSEPSIPKGEYEVEVSTNSSMFHLNETTDGIGTLKVTDEGMTVHMTLVSKKITNLYVGKVDQAEADEAGWIQPTTDTVTYDDGYTEEVYGFDVPVPALDEPFDVAILGTKGKWYDHTVTVSAPVSD